MSDRVTMMVPNVPQCNRILYKGLKGEDVKWIQDILSELNDFYKFCPSTTSLKTTGYFGDETAKFVKFFQYFENLIPDSHFDRATCERMNYRYNDYLDIQLRTGWGKYKTQEEYLNSRFEEEPAPKRNDNYYLDRF